MTNDRPNFKFVFEKSDEITDTDIKAFLESYKYKLFISPKERQIDRDLTPH